MAKKPVKEEAQAAPETAAPEPQAETAVAVRPEAQLPSAETDLNAWGASPVSAKDIIIPRIMLMQPMSDAVTNGQAAFGEFRESLSNEKLGDFSMALDIVPFMMRKIWVEYDVTLGTDMKNKKFLRVTPVTPANEGLPYNDEEKNPTGPVGSKIKIMRDYVQEFFVLLPKELELGGAIPYILSFRRSSLQAGKKLATQMFVKNMAASRVPPAVLCTVLSKKETNDQGTFAVMDVLPKKSTPNEWVIECFKWLQMIQGGKAKIDESSYAAEGGEGQAGSSGMPTSDGPAQF